MNRGSMCVTELYGKHTRVKVIQALIKNRKQDDNISLMKEELDRLKKKSNCSRSTTIRIRPSSHKMIPINKLTVKIGNEIEH